MNNITELLQSTLQLRSKECLKTYLESCDEYCAFLVKDRNNETLLKQINALLNGNEDERHQGLSLLQTYVAQCTVRVFSENAVNWLLQCLKISLYKDAPDTCCLSLHVFKTILSMSVKFPEVAKEVAKQVVPKFLLEHVKRRLKNLVATVQVLQCIEVCMRNYGGPTGDFRNDISNIVCHLLESGCATVTIAAKCFALLPHIGSGGSQGVTHKTAWSQQQAVVIKKIHDILDDLFANINEIQAYTRPKIELASVVLNIPHHGDPSPVVRAQKLAKQFAGLAQFLQAMLLGDFAVAKTVLPSIIMGVVCRCLSVTHTMLSNRVSADSQALMSMLPLIHTSALQTLDALIHCCGRNLILYGRTICRLITQVIKSTSTEDWPYAINKPHRSQRVAALKTLSLWLTVARSSSSVEAYAEDILTLLLVDIQSEKQSVTLTLSRKGHKGKKLNKQQSASLSLSDQEYSEKLGKVLANRRLCVAALRAVQNILQVVGSTVKPELHKAVLRVVLSLVIKVTQSCNNDVPIPYSDAKCRLSLYQLLHTLCTDPHPSDAPPVQYAVHLFSAGLKDTEIQVQLFCQRSLSTIEKITHPNAPSLYFPLQPAENQLHGAARLCSDLDRPLSSIANKDGYVVLRLVQEGGHTLLEPAKNVVPENVSRLSNENVASTADYQPDAESKGIVISKPFSINSEEQEPYVETDGNYYQEEYEDDDDDDGGSGRDGDDVDDEENLNYDDECVDENDDENEIGEEVGEEVCEEAGDEGDEEIGEELGEEEVGEDAGEDGSDLPVISLSSGSEKAMEEEEEEEEEEEMGEEEEEEEEDEEMDEEEEDDVEECPRGVGKHMHDEEQVVLSRLATKRQYNNIEIRPLPGEKRSLHFEERREQKRFKPSQENFVPVSQPMQILQSGQLNKNVCGKTDFVKPVSNSIPVKHENELVEPEKDSKKVNTNFAEPENALEKTRSPSVESEKAENDFVEPEKAENDSVEPEKAENDSVEPEKAENDPVEPEKTENDSVEPENGLEKTVTDSVHPKNEEECVVQEECVIEEEDKTDIVKPENDSVEPTNDSVRVESDTEKFNDDSTKLENDSGKLENDDGKLNNDSGVLENESVKPDLNMEVEEEESAAQIDEPELQLEPETKKTDEVVTTSEIDKEVPQSETNGCEQSVVEDEVRKEKQADSKIETEVELVAKDSDASNKTEEVVEDDVCKEKQIDSKIETEVELVAKDSDASNKTEVDTVESKQPQQPNVKDTENETVTTEDVRTNNVENSQEEDKKDENSQETQCNNKENEHSSENDSNVESKSLEVCKNVNTVCKDNDDNIDEDAMVKDFVDAVESLV